jgi:RNA polymerase sigma-70 factor (ECF subfamily)
MYRAVAAERTYLLRFARTRLRDEALVEDVVQEALLGALRAHERFTHRSSLRTWLTGILLNKISDAVGREQRRRALEDERVVVPGDADDEERTQSHEPIEWRDPERLVAGRQIVALLQRNLKDLPVRAARALMLHEIDGLSLDETARQLGVTARNVSVLLHRARKRLRLGLQAVAAA